MSEKTIINGWTIHQGDYIVDGDYNELYQKSKRREKIRRSLLIISSTLGLAIIMIITLVLKTNQ